MKDVEFETKDAIAIGTMGCGAIGGMGLVTEKRFVSAVAHGQRVDSGPLPF